MNVQRARRSLGIVSGDAELQLPSGSRAPVSYHVRAEQHVVDGEPGTEVWEVSLTFRRPSADALGVEIMRLAMSDDLALLDASRENLPWTAQVSLVGSPPIPWQLPAILLFRFEGQPPDDLRGRL